MSPKYTINKHEGEHLDYINRLHLAREWNRRIEAMDATLSFRTFARSMHIPEASWRREYRRGGGTDPVRDLRFPNRWLYGTYDPDLAQQKANERAAQKGPRQKLLKPVADRIRDLVKEPDRHRSLFDALHILQEQDPERALPCLRTLYNHVQAGGIGLTCDDLHYRRRHKRKRNPAHPARTAVGRRKLEDRPAEAVTPTEAGHLRRGLHQRHAPRLARRRHRRAARQGVAPCRLGCVITLAIRPRETSARAPRYFFFFQTA